MKFKQSEEAVVSRIRPVLLWIFLIIPALNLPFMAFGVPAEGQKIMIAGPSATAVEIGKGIYSKGGNVVDVAVAVAMSLAVTSPYFGSVGGGGFAITKMGNEVTALDFRETAPKAATKDLFTADKTRSSRNGAFAVGVPGNLAGYWELHKKYGKLKWADLMRDSIRLAESGFRVSGEWVFLTNHAHDKFNDAARSILAGPKGKRLGPGDMLKQPQLAKLLREVSRGGARVFYNGPIAKDIVDTINAGKGILTLEDLKSYKVRWLKPMTADFAGHKIYLMPPPSSGGVVISQALRMMDKVKIQEKAPLSVDELHLLIEIMKLSYRGRSLLGDPDFAKNPIDQLLSDKYINEMVGKINPNKVIDVEPLRDVMFEKEDTTHFSVMDGAGNAVAMTITLNGNYGSGLVTPKYGIALNNEMDDFTTELGQPNLFGLIQGENNQVRGGARPLSSMSPTIVEKDGKTVMAVGSPGGPRIISGVLQVLYRSLTQPFDMDEAIQAPRVHHQFLPNKAYADDLRFSPEILTALRAKGHVLETGRMGKVYGIRKVENGILNGAADSRGEAGAGGY